MASDDPAPEGTYPFAVPPTGDSPYKRAPASAMPAAATLKLEHWTRAGFYWDADHDGPNPKSPVRLSPAERLKHFVDIAPTGCGKTTMQVERAVCDHFSTAGPSFYFCGSGRKRVPDDVMAALSAMPDMEPRRIKNHVRVIPLGSMLPGITFADLRKYTTAVRERSNKWGTRVSETDVRRRAVANLRDNVAEFIRVASRDPPAEQHSRPLYQLIHLAPEIAFDPAWRDLAVVPPRNDPNVCPMSDFVTIMHRVAHFIQTDQWNKLPVGDLALDSANQHLTGLLNYGPEVFGNIVSGATTRLMTVLKHPRLKMLLDNTERTFSFRHALDSRWLYVFDTSGLAGPAQSLATLALMQELYLATEQRAGWLQEQGETYVVNVLLDEAPRLLGFEPVQEWMAEARNNKIGLDLTLQTETQYAEEDQEHLIDEQRTNFGTIQLRTPTPDDDLAQMFRTGETEIEKMQRELRDINRFTRWQLADKYRGEPAWQTRYEPHKIGFHPGRPPAWDPTSEARAGPYPEANPQVEDHDHTLRLPIEPDDPYPFNEKLFDKHKRDVVPLTKRAIGLSDAQERALGARGPRRVPAALQTQYNLEPEAIETAVAIAIAHERQSGREQDGWVSQRNVIARLLFWQELGPLDTTAAGDDAGDDDGASAGMAGIEGVGAGDATPATPVEWESVFRRLPSVNHEPVPPEPDDWPAYFGPLDEPFLSLTDDGLAEWQQYDTVGWGQKAGGGPHGRMLHRSLAPFRSLGFEGGVVTQQEGLDQPDARAFAPGIPPLHLEAEYQGLQHPAQVGRALAGAQAADAFPIFIAPMVGPDDETSRSDTYWAEQLWHQCVDPVAARTTESVTYYVHRDRTIDFDGGAEQGGWTTARPITPGGTATAAAATADGDGSTATAGHTPDDSGGDADTGTPGATAAAGTGEAAAAARGDRATVWRHDGEAYVLKDDAGHEYARLDRYTEPSAQAFPARFQNVTAGNDDQPDKYRVETFDGDRWQPAATYDSRTALETDYIPVKQPFIPEVALAHPPDPSGVAVVLVETDPATSPADATIKWYDGRRDATDEPVIRPIGELPAALETKQLSRATGDWPTRREPVAPPAATVDEPTPSPPADGAERPVPADGDATVDARIDAEAAAVDAPSGEEPASQLPDLLSQDLTAIADQIQTDRPTGPSGAEPGEAAAASPPMVLPEVGAVDSRVDPDYDIDVDVVVAVFAYMGLAVESGHASDGEPLRDEGRAVYDEWFVPFVDALPVEASISYTVFRDTLTGLYAPIRVETVSTREEFVNAERRKDRPDPARAATQLGIAAYVADAVTVTPGSEAPIPVARDQCQAFAMALGLVPDEAAGEEDPAYDPDHFSRWVRWYAALLLRSAPPDAVGIEIDRTADVSVPDRFLDDQGRVRVWSRLDLTPTTTQIPEAPPHLGGE